MRLMSLDRPGFGKGVLLLFMPFYLKSPGAWGKALDRMFDTLFLYVLLPLSRRWTESHLQQSNSLNIIDLSCRKF
ncbi:hypothetical protein BDR26DRAFT_855154 [Obelidium mucronatum]|nr:hypothetical protein BDR26DRAFT_855154 [Obelidium mucronatum]